MLQDYISDDNTLTLKNGIWFSESTEEVSFPEEYRDMLFEVEDKSFWFRHRNRFIIEAVKSYPPKGMIFDVGGGNGFVSKGLSDAGFEVALVEPGVGGARNAKTLQGFDVVCATFSKENFRQGSVSAVALFDVIEHIEDVSSFLCEVRSLMRPGGYIYLTVPAFMWLWSEVDSRDGHFKRYTAESLRRLLCGSGFDVLFDTYFFGYLPIPIFLARTLPYKLGHRRRFPNKELQREVAFGGG